MQLVFVSVYLFLLFAGFVPDSLNYAELKSFEQNFKLEAYSSSFDQKTGTVYFFNNENKRLIQSSPNNITTELEFSDEIFADLQVIEVSKDGRYLLFWEEGGGQVYSYNLSTQMLTRLDSSESFKAFYDHSGFLTEDGDIYIMGGRGYFEDKKTLLKFDVAQKAWVEITSNGTVPVRSSNSVIWYVEDDNVLYYFTFDIPNGSTSKLYTFNLRTGIWSLSAEYNADLSDQQRMLNNLDRKRSYGIDYDNSLVFINSFVFLDYKTKDLFVFEKDNYFGSLKGLVHYFYPQENQWVMIGLKNIPLFEFGITSYTTKDLISRQDLTVVGPLKVYEKYWFVTIFGGLLFGVTIWYGVRYLNNGKSTNLSAAPDILLVLRNNNLKIELKGSPYIVTDPLELKVWYWIYQNVSDNVYEVAQKDFDDDVLNNITTQSQISRTRKKLFNTINNELNIELLKNEQSRIDKRYRVIIIDSSKVSIGDHLV